MSEEMLCALLGDSSSILPSEDVAIKWARFIVLVPPGRLVSKVFSDPEFGPYVSAVSPAVSDMVPKDVGRVLIHWLQIHYPLVVDLIGGSEEYTMWFRDVVTKLLEEVKNGVASGPTQE